MKHASCGLQNQKGLHPQQDSLAACLGSNITFPSSWTPWASALMSPLGVIVVGGMERVVSLMLEVTSMLEVGDTFMKSPSFQAMVNGCKLLVFSVDFSNNGVPVCFKLGALLVVALVALHFGRGHEVEGTDRHSQSKEWSPCGLEELLAPVGHGVELSL
jgi:hypothetical protein